MIDYRTEYRINKKGAECFRSADYDEARRKLDELNARRPGVYTMQSRTVRVNRFGVKDQDWLGRPAWSPWR